MTLTDPHAGIRSRVRAAITQSAPGASPVVTWAFTSLDHADPLTTAERLVLTTLALAAEIDLHTRNGYDGYTAVTIAHMTGLSENHGRRAVHALIRRGLLVTSTGRPDLIRLPEEAFNH